MPEIKNNFIRGRMNKDLDERLVPNGEYRDAMNIQVSTSEEDSVGTVQNVLGNIRVGHQLPQLTCVGSVADEKNNQVYYLATTSIGNIKSYIFRYSIDTSTHEIIFRDLLDILKFRPQNILTGINVVDDMMFFTDDFSEPKKINIERCLAGTDQNDDAVHTELIVNGITIGDIEESHITVIKKAPNYAPELEMISDIPEGNIAGLIPSNNQALVNNPQLTPSLTFQFDQINAGDTFEVVIDPTPDADGFDFNINIDDEVVFSLYEDNIPAIPLSDFLVRGVVTNKTIFSTEQATLFEIRVITISDDVPIGLTENNQLPTYAMSLFIEPKGMFEFKFPRFSTRYKYEDGEYSSFGPFSEIAFVPGDFDYEPKKGYNIGMTNKLKQLFLKEFVSNDIPEDVVSIDLLYKESDSTSVFVLASLSSDDPIITSDPYNGLNEYTFQNSVDIQTDIGLQTRNIKRQGLYEVKSETLYALVNQNQLIRPYDNVPIKAKSQEITGNRIIYGNYVQNYDLPSFNDKLIFNEDTFTFDLTTGKPYKSVKSLREYQLGVVYLDEYGRQSPVLTGTNASVSLPKSTSDQSSRLYARIKGAAPSWASSFKFYIKQTSGEFYNLAMDRFYDAKDGNIWLAFPSSDRNKVDIDTFLILKKGADSDFSIKNLARYKILAIENNAPDYIKTVYKPLGSRTHDNTTNDLFGNVGGSLVGKTELTIEPDAGGIVGYSFKNSSLFNIYEKIEDRKVRVRFEDSEGNESNSYEVSNVGYDPDTNGIPVGALYLTIKDDFGTDVEFLTLDNTTGLHNSQIKDNVIIVFEEITVENAAKFDGRFFVKIYNNETTRQEIGSTVSTDTQKYRRLASKAVYYLSENNVDIHSYSGVGPNPGSQDPFATPVHPTGGSSSPSDYHSQGITLPTTFNSPTESFILSSQHERSFFYKWNAFFRGDISYSINDRSQASSSSFEDVWFIDGHTPSRIIGGGNPSVIGTDHTGGNAGINTYSPTSIQDGVPYNNGIGIDGANRGVIELGFGGLEPGNPASAPYSILNVDYFAVRGNIFNGLGVGGAVTQNNINGQQGTVNAGQAFAWTKGTSSIYNIGQENKNIYYGNEQEDFIENLAIGSKIRWREDNNTPQNVYTIEDIEYYYVLRYEEPCFKSGNNPQGREWYGENNSIQNQGGDGQLMVYSGNAEPAFALRPENYQVRFRLILDRELVWNPLDSTTLGPSQSVMNGFSPNSVEAFAKLGSTVTAQGYTLEIVEDDNRDDLKISTNPAIWETEPKDQIDLDVYYEASDKYPITLNKKNIFDVLKIGSKVRDINNSGDPANQPFTQIEYIIDGIVEDDTIILNYPSTGTHFTNYTFPTPPGDPVPIVEITTPDGQRFQFSVIGLVPGTLGNQLTISRNMHNSGFKLNWFNCYSFGNGVESNRIEDNFNRVFIDKGAIASTTIEEGLYKQERRKYGLIFSGLYNSTSGVNNLNQFIQAENITKDVNPNYGSIQKLFSRQSDLIALCEDKILKILANKDAVFNADGNPQLTANQNVLGQTIPFVGDYGISKNPESFASESYRAYFTDKQRGAVLRLSMDGLTPISDAGMSDWFGDNLESSKFLIGSYDQDKSKYNLVINYGNYFGTRHIFQGKTYNLINNDIGAYCLSFSERNKGWVTFNSFIYESAISAANKYFTFKYGNIYEHHVNNSNRNTFYPTSFYYGPDFGTVDADGVYTNSNVKFIFNQEPNIIKEFRALNYEGSKSRLLDEYSDNSYKNLNDQEGWFSSNITTNLEQGVVPYFVEKESKWFNYIKGNSISFLNNSKNIDATKFSVQGIGIVDTVVVQPPPPVYGCTDDGNDPNFPGRPTGFVGEADNYNALANTDDGSCVWTVVLGCTDPSAVNYNPNANVDDNSCILPIYGCTDPNALNYDPSANINQVSATDTSNPCVYAPPAPPPLQPAQILNAIDPSITIDYVDGQGNVVGSNQGTALPLPNSGAGNLFNVNISTASSGEQTINFTYNFDFAPAYGGTPPYTYSFSMVKFYIDGPGAAPTAIENASFAAGLPYAGSYIGAPNGIYGDAGTNSMFAFNPQPTGVPLSSHTPGQPGTTVTHSISIPSTFSSNNLNDFPLIGGSDVEKIAVAFQIFTSDSTGATAVSNYNFNTTINKIESVASVTSPVYGVINTPLTPGAWTHSSTTNIFASVSANVNFAAATGGIPPYTYSNLGYREVDTAAGGVIPGQSGTFNNIGSGNPYFSLSNYSWGPINWPSLGQGNPNEMYVEFTVDITDSAGTTVTSTDIQTYNRPLFIGPQPWTAPTNYDINDIEYYAMDYWTVTDLSGNTFTTYPGYKITSIAEVINFKSQGLPNIVGVLNILIEYGNGAQGGTPPYLNSLRSYYNPNGAIFSTGGAFTYWQNDPLLYPHGPRMEMMTIDFNNPNFSWPPGGINPNPANVNGITANDNGSGNAFISGGPGAPFYLPESLTRDGIIVDTSYMDTNPYAFHLYDSNQFGATNGGFGHANGTSLTFKIWMDTQEINTGNTANPVLQDITVTY